MSTLNCSFKELFILFFVYVRAIINTEVIYMNDLSCGERVKYLRKELGLTLEKFGEPLGVKKNSVSQIENGHNSLTDQMAKAICREYHVNYAWLINGDGEIFSNDDAELKEKLDQIMEGESEFHKTLIKSIINLDDEALSVIQSLVDALSKK